MSRSESGRVVDVSIAQFQRLIKRMYFEKDHARGIPATFLWLTEEIGELASALRETEHARCLSDQATRETKSIGESEAVNLRADFAAKHKNLAEEFADVFAWLATIANVAEIDLSEALFDKYGAGCPGCEQFVCTCPDEEKP